MEGRRHHLYAARTGTLVREPSELLQQLIIIYLLKVINLNIAKHYLVI